MEKILVLNRVFFRLSETFIYRQVLALEKEFDVKLLANEFENNIQTSVVEKYRLPKTSGFSDRILTAIVRRVFNIKLHFSLATVIFISKLLRKEKISLIHAHYGWSGIQIFKIARLNQIPLIVSFHGMDASGSLRHKQYKEQLPSLFNYAKAIIICSPHMVQTLSLQKWMYKVHLIPYGVDVNYFLPLERKEVQATIKILHAGRLVAKKGVPDLIRAYTSLRKKFNNIELHIVGDGEELELCSAAAVQGGAGDSITFYGAQPISNVKKLMQETDVFVLNSRTDDDGDMEGLPNALLEAMSCERAIVSTWHAGIPQVVMDGVNGLLVPEKDNDALATALEKLILNETLRKELGQKGRQKIAEEFSLEQMGSALRAVCRSSAKQ